MNSITKRTKHSRSSFQNVAVLADGFRYLTIHEYIIN